MTTNSEDDSKRIEEVKIGIQYSPTIADIGPLISAYGDEPEILARANGYRKYGEENEVEISVQRTHEWEHVIVLTAIGVGAFATSVIKTLGERTGNWIADQFQEQDARSVRIHIGDERPIEISQEEAEQGRIIVDKFEEASDRSQKLIIEFE